MAKFLINCLFYEKINKILIVVCEVSGSVVSWFPPNPIHLAPNVRRVGQEILSTRCVVRILAFIVMLGYSFILSVSAAEVWSYSRDVSFLYWSILWYLHFMYFVISVLSALKLLFLKWPLDMALTLVRGPG